jgi:ribosomal protein S18 acetylase RimI-like enzyme
LAEGDSRAVRYPLDVALFAALPDDPKPEDWEALRRLIGPNNVAVLFREEVQSPDGWEDAFRIPTVQMTGDGAERGESSRATKLGPSDVPEMLDLVRRTQPGPFSQRTIELGTYLGIREGGTLVAMAGERMRIAGHTEISAVCTAAEHRGRGLASELMGVLIAAMAACGDVPFLHAVADNVTAIHLYETLGFTTRRVFDVVGLRAPA